MIDKARLLTQLSNARDPLTVLLRNRLHPTTVNAVMDLLEAGSGRLTAKPTPDRMTGDAIKDELLSIFEAPRGSPPATATSVDDVATAERADELYAEAARRGEAFSEPDPYVRHQMDLHQRLHEATQSFDYSAISLDYIKSTFKRPPVDLIGGSAQGNYRILQTFGDGMLIAVNADKRMLNAVNAAVTRVAWTQEVVDSPLGPSYADDKRMALAIRFPVRISRTPGEQSTVIFEVWWFADERNEYNMLRSSAERLSSFNADEVARLMLAGEFSFIRNIELGRLLQPVVGDRMWQEQATQETIQAVASGLVMKGAEKAAGRLQRMSSGTGGKPVAAVQGSGGKALPAASSDEGKQVATAPSKGPIDVNKRGAFRQLRGANPERVAEALADPELPRFYWRNRKEAEGHLDDLAHVISQHSTNTQGRAKVHPTVAAAVWALPDAFRGVLIERTLANTEYKSWFNVGRTDNGFFPDIDFARRLPDVNSGTSSSEGATRLISVKTVNPFAKSFFDKQLAETLPEHIESLVAGTDNLRRSGRPVPNTIVDIRVPTGSDVAASFLRQTLQELIPSHLKRYLKVEVHEF